MSKISLQMYTLRDFTENETGLRSSLERLLKLGFSNLQYSVPRFMTAPALKELLELYGMRMDSVACPASEIKEKLSQLAGQCGLFNVYYICVDSIPGSMTTPEGFAEYAHMLNSLGELLAPYGIKLLYHFHSFEFVSYGSENGMDIFLRETDPEYVLIMPDTYWIAAAGISPADFISRYRSRIRYVHVKDYAIVRHGENTDSSVVRFAEVGRGNLDWPKITAVCESFGCVSYVIEQDNCYGRDPFECAALSMANLRRFGIE